MQNPMHRISPRPFLHAAVRNCKFHAQTSIYGRFRLTCLRPCSNIGLDRATRPDPWGAFYVAFCSLVAVCSFFARSAFSTNRQRDHYGRGHGPYRSRGSQCCYRSEKHRDRRGLPGSLNRHGELHGPPVADRIVRTDDDRAGVQKVYPAKYHNSRRASVAPRRPAGDWSEHGSRHGQRRVLVAEDGNRRRGAQHHAGAAPKSAHPGYRRSERGQLGHPQSL